MAQHLQCEPLTLATMTIGTPALVPGAVVLCADPIVVELPKVEYTVTQVWPDPQNLPLLNTLVLVADFRGPPQTSLYTTSCHGARSCAPHLVMTSFVTLPRGGDYAAK